MADQASGSGLQNIKTDQLLWDCVAVGTFQLKVIYLTNPFRRCLKLEVAILEETRNSFHLVVTHENFERLEKKTTKHFQPREQREIKVVFMPNGLGAVEAVVHAWEIPEGKQKQLFPQKSVEMFGYGGLVSVEWSLKRPGPDNDVSFTLSETHHQKMCVLTQYIECQNDGNVPAFICVLLHKRYMPFCADLNVVGEDCVIKPKQNCIVFVNLVIKDNIWKYFRNNSKVMAVHVGVLKLYWGSEILRRRLRRLVIDAKEKDCKTLSLEFARLLCKGFCFEETFLEDEVMFDLPEHIEQLLQAVNVNVIPLTVRRNV